MVTAELPQNHTVPL